jgi:hypothetical protein
MNRTIRLTIKGRPATAVVELQLRRIIPIDGRYNEKRFLLGTDETNANADGNFYTTVDVDAMDAPSVIRWFHESPNRIPGGGFPLGTLLLYRWN